MTQANEQAKSLSGNLTMQIVSMSLTSAIGFLALLIVDLVDMLHSAKCGRRKCGI